MHDEQLAAFAITKTASMHQILGHASNDAITHLENPAEWVTVVDKDGGQVTKTNECETCALSKAHRIISGKPEIRELGQAILPGHL